MGPTVREQKKLDAERLAWFNAWNVAVKVTDNFTHTVSYEQVMNQAGKLAREWTSEERGHYLDGSPTKTPNHGYHFGEVICWGGDKTTQDVVRRITRLTLFSDAMRIVDMAGCAHNAVTETTTPVVNAHRPSKTAWIKAARNQAEKNRRAG